MACTMCDEPVENSQEYAASKAKFLCHYKADRIAQKKATGVMKDEYIDNYMMFYRQEYIKEYTTLYTLYMEKYKDTRRLWCLNKQTICSDCYRDWKYID